MDSRRAKVVIEIDPTVDYACKMLLGNPSHPRLTIHFLNAVLKREPRIVHVDYLNPIVAREFELDKLAILDILARDEQGRRFNIEVQRTRPSWLPERLTYYVAIQLVEQIADGDSYAMLRPSIGICLLRAKLYPDLEGYHQQFRLRTQMGWELTDRLEIHTLELPKYPRRYDNIPVENPLDQWMEFFRSAEGSTVEQLRQRLPSPVFTEAIGVLEMISKTPEERRYYDARRKWELDENTWREAARLELEAAVKEGETRGEARGESRGEARGKAEGTAMLIRTLQRLLGDHPTDASSLLEMPPGALDELATELQNRMSSRLDDPIA